MKILSNIIKAIDNFFNPKCNACGNGLSDMGGSTFGITPEPVIVCTNPACKK
jgi:hypothetical protein